MTDLPTGCVRVRFAIDAPSSGGTFIKDVLTDGVPRAREMVYAIEGEEPFDVLFVIWPTNGKPPLCYLEIEDGFIEQSEVASLLANGWRAGTEDESFRPAP